MDMMDPLRRGVAPIVIEPEDDMDFALVKEEMIDDSLSASSRAEPFSPEDEDEMSNNTQQPLLLYNDVLQSHAINGLPSSTFDSFSLRDKSTSSNQPDRWSDFFKQKCMERYGPLTNADALRAECDKEQVDVIPTVKEPLPNPYCKPKQKELPLEISCFNKYIVDSAKTSQELEKDHCESSSEGSVKKLPVFNSNKILVKKMHRDLLLRTFPDVRPTKEPRHKYVRSMETTYGYCHGCDLHMSQYKKHMAKSSVRLRCPQKGCASVQITAYLFQRHWFLNHKGRCPPAHQIKMDPLACSDFWKQRDIQLIRKKLLDAPVSGYVPVLHSCFTKYKYPAYMQKCFVTLCCIPHEYLMKHAPPSFKLKPDKCQTVQLPAKTVYQFSRADQRQCLPLQGFNDDIALSEKYPTAQLPAKTVYQFSHADERQCPQDLNDDDTSSGKYPSYVMQRSASTTRD